MRRLKWIAPLVCLLAACDRPTAPEARAIARSFERKFEEGDFRGLTQMFVMQMSPAGFFYSSSYARNQALQIERNGVRQTVNGFVVEDVVIAPGGVGRPRIRRTLVGWPNDFAFAVHALTEAHPGAVSSRESNYWRMQPRTHAVVHFRDTTDVMPDISRDWMGRSGVIDISEGVVERGCGTATEPLPYNSQDPTVTCDFASFQVDVRAEFTRVADSSALIRKPQHLRITRQVIPGVRFVTHCAEAVPQSPHTRTPPVSAWECQDPMQFWRHNDQYAPQLGINLAEFRRLEGSQNVYLRKTPRSQNDRPVGPRWSIFTPGGQLIERDSATDETTTQAARDRLSDLAFVTGHPDNDRRIVALVPARRLDPRASRYAIFVLDMELSAAP